MRGPYGDGDRDQPEVGGDVEEEDDVAVELGDGGLAVVCGEVLVGARKGLLKMTHSRGRGRFASCV